MSIQQNQEKRPQPAPDSPRKPDSPTDIKGRSWRYILKRTLREFSADKCTDLAAAMTYYAVLSIFPGLLAVVSILGIVGQGEATTRTIIELLERLGAPADALGLIEGPINQLTSGTGAGLALATGIIGAIWTASGYVRAFGRAMNTMYDVDEGRPFWKLYPVMLGVTLTLVIVVVIMMLVLILSGGFAQTLGNMIGLGDTALMVWNIAKWPVLVLLVIFMIALLYYATPNVKQPKFRWISIGALVAIIVMALATAGFGFYVANFGNYNATYGTIGGVIVLLLWIWIMNVVLLLGGEIDAEIERGRQLQAGIKAEETLQLPARDDRQCRKLNDKALGLVNDGRDLRYAYGHTDYRDR
ncbi:tRNA processing ribonuclease BN [Arthrobacter crystallopoietes BAB-32]|uniref:tRNA processing ribonuclease BN n=1 Tax=Arthrobacter crystallopoietes BAB-32 TaxID=1246476 RepID=N1V858_9MICC|nr:YihY/virulence factor BrkB family protein [Arthrobacter crystallopoietes]EMY34438.1 tRNA processing ribonuclease BN [Arthrobacter crystallopoietes BAB-32]